MKRASLATLVLTIGAAACQDIITSPEPSADRDVLYGVSNPPPPPIDTGAMVTFSATEPTSFEQSTPSQPGFSIRLASSLQASCTGDAAVIIPVTYLYNPQGSSGYLHFSDAPAQSVDASANGMVKMKEEGGVQDFSGKGAVSILIGDCEFIINLESVVDAQSSFGACDTIIPDAIGTQRVEQGCFTLSFSEVLLNGVDVGDATMTPAPECEPGDLRAECNPEIGPPPEVEST